MATTITNQFTDGLLVLYSKSLKNIFSAFEITLITLSCFVHITDLFWSVWPRKEFRLRARERLACFRMICCGTFKMVSA